MVRRANGVLAKMVWVMETCRRHWTMLVETVLTVTLSVQMDLVTTPTLLKHIAIMLLTAISKKKAKVKAPVNLLARQLSLQLTLALVAVLTPPVPVVEARP